MNASSQAPGSPRREAWQRLAGGLLFRIFILLLILYTVYHCIIALTPRMTTAVVTEAEEALVTEGMATIFRDETVIRTAGQGLLLSYPLENGAKVGATSEVINVYTTALDDGTLEELQTRLGVLDSLIVASARAERQYDYSTSAMGSASLAAIHDDVLAHILYLSRGFAAGTSFSALTAARAELLISLDAYAAITGADTTDIRPTEALYAQKSALLSTVMRGVRTMTLADLLYTDPGEQGLPTFSGYFYHADAVDGYETVFTRNALATMNITEYDAMLAMPPAADTVGATVLGKVVQSYTWSIALPMAYELADAVKLGESYSVVFPGEDGATLTMTTERIIRSVGDGRAVVVLSCDTMPQNFRFTRHQTVQLVLQSVQGYRIPDTALQTVDGRECVYVLDDGSVRLREVEVLLRGEGYVIVARPGEDFENGLSRYDVVITSGKDLYDGKYID